VDATVEFVERVERADGDVGSHESQFSVISYKLYVFGKARKSGW
jgi:hypothetical protein